MTIALNDEEISIINQITDEIKAYILSHISRPKFIQFATQIIQGLKFEGCDETHSSVYRIRPEPVLPEQLGFLLTCYFNAKLFNRHFESQANIDAIYSNTNFFEEQKNGSYMLKFTKDSPAENKFKQLKTSI